MTTISTTDELIALLRENQEFREAVRREILTEDLFGLPGEFTSMSERQNTILQIQGTIVDIQKTMAENMVDLQQTQNRMLETQNRVLNQLENIDTRVDRMGRDFGNFRGNYAEDRAAKYAADIAFRLNESKALDIDDSTAFVLRSEGVAALASEDGSKTLADLGGSLRSNLYRADLIIEVQKSDRATKCYIVVEVSYTCDQTDTRRAISRAAILSEFTGTEAWPAIAGIRKDRNIQDLIDRGEVFWYALGEDELRPDAPT